MAQIFKFFNHKYLLFHLETLKIVNSIKQMILKKSKTQ
jgi:hypothetical protein